jgi:uncharacterized protein with HEPN domain
VSGPDADIERVRAILGCIEAIDRADAVVGRHQGDLDAGRVANDAVRLRLMLIGETVQTLSLDMREDHPAVAWSQMVALPDLVGPPDSEADPESIRATVGGPLTALRSACRAILAESVRVGEDEP